MENQKKDFGKNEAKFYSETYDAIWNQYLFLTSVRERLEHKCEIILILVGIYIAVYFQLKIYKIHTINYIPLFFLFLIFIFTLYHVIPRKITIPWVDKDQFYDYEDSELIHKQLIDECYKYIEDIRALEYRYKFYLKIIILSLLFSILFPVISIILKNNYFLYIDPFVFDPIVLSFIFFIFIIILEIIFYKKFDTAVVKYR